MKNPFKMRRPKGDPLRDAFGPYVAEHIADLDKVLEGRGSEGDMLMKRVRANQMLHMAHGTMHQCKYALIGCSRQFGMNPGQMRRALEAGENLTGDITDFVTQSIHTSLDVLPRLLANRLVSIQPLNQPSGYAFTMTRRDGADTRDLADLTTFDKTFADDPGEGQQIEKAKVTLSKARVDCRYKKLMGEWSWEVDVALQSQYMYTIEDLHDDMSAEEIAWEVDRDVIDRVAAFAARDYYFDPNPNNNFDTLAPTEQKAYREQFLSVGLGAAETDMEAVIFRPPNWFIAGTNVITWLRAIATYGSDRISREGDMSISTGQIPSSGFRIDNRPVWHDPQLDPDLMLMGYTESMDPFYAGYIYLPFGAASKVTAAFEDPNTLLTRKARALAYATHGVKSRQYSRLWLRRAS